MAGRNEILVHSFQPNKREVKDFSNLLLISSRTNPELVSGVVKGVSQAAHFTSRVDNGWLADAFRDLPRSDKKYCQHLADIAARPYGERRSTSGFYKPHRRSLPWYTTSMRRVIVTQEGVVGRPCGYVQQHDACETKVSLSFSLCIFLITSARQPYLASSYLHS
jgi:hypothetical protein